MKTFSIECSGDKHNVILNDDGSFALIHHDIEEEETLDALGDNTSKCYQYIKTIQQPSGASSLLVILAMENDVDTMRILLDMGFADVHYKIEEPLCQAACSGKDDAVKLLLEHGADIHHADFGLTYAAAHGHASTVRILLDAGADPNIFHYTSSLVQAANAGHAEIVKMLLEAGASINVFTNDVIDAVVSDNPEVIQILKDAGVRL